MGQVILLTRVSISKHKDHGFFYKYLQKKSLLGRLTEEFIHCSCDVNAFILTNALKISLIKQDFLNCSLPSCAVLILKQT